LGSDPACFGLDFEIVPLLPLVSNELRKLEAELGWKLAETFETGIRKTVEWYLANPEWVANVQSGAYKDWVSKQ
jgi:hypothetical protein